MYTKSLYGFIYDVFDDHAELRGCELEDAAELAALQTIPESVDGKPVTMIADNTFSYLGIKKLKLPCSISTIGSKAFCKSAIEEIHFYMGTSGNCHWVLTINSSAFKECENLLVFNTQQFVIAEYLAFTHCYRLKSFGSVQFKCVHPDAFAHSGVEHINLANNGWLQTNSLNHSRIESIHLKDAAQIPAKTMDYIRRKDIKLHVYSHSPLMELVYEGFSVVEKPIDY